MQLKRLNKGQILDTAKANIYGERQQAYGIPRKHLDLVAAHWNAYLIGRGSTPLLGHDVALLLALLKVARLIETPDHTDSWADLAGYAAIGGEVATEGDRQRPLEEALNDRLISDALSEAACAHEEVG